MKGSTIVVLGGTSGIGLAAARALLSAGASVVAIGREDEHLLTAADLLTGAVVKGDDAARPGCPEDAIALANHHFGGFDGLYHVAGGSGRRHGDGPLHEITDEGWSETLRINLTSLFHSNRAAVRELLSHRKGGVILNTSSVLAQSPSPTLFNTHAYAAAKSAILGLTRSCAAAYAANGIRFNCILPGLVESPMSQRAMGRPDIMGYAQTKQPLSPGACQPEDLAQTAVYLLSRASRMVTGQAVAVDGGWSVSEGQLIHE